MGEPFLVLESVSKRFGGTQALASVSLHVMPDELLVVLGPTGAGKTTLLRTIAGLEAPDAGAIRMAGEDVTAAAAPQRDVALVFQNFSLYPNWSVRRNLEFPLRAPGRNLGREQITERVEWAARMLRIEHLLDRRSVHLSGGEMQRVAIGRAIVRRPRIFLMDEPLTNLDAKLRESLRVELVRLRRSLRTPMVFVTHDQVEAMSMGDRVVVLGEGRVLQGGTPEEIYRRPASPEVARQLGQPPINLIPVRRCDGAWLGESGTPIVAAAGAGRDERMLLGVRPEDIALTGGAIPGRVRVVQQMGPARVLLVEWAGREVHILAPQAAEIRPGAEVFPHIDADRVLLWPGR